MGAVRHRGRGAGNLDRLDLTVMSLGADDHRVDHEARSRLAQSCGQSVVETHPGDRRWQGGDFEDASLEPVLELRQRLVRAAQAQDRGEANPFLGLDPALQRAHQPVGELPAVEAPGQEAAGQVTAALGGRLELERACRDRRGEAGMGEVVREKGGVEVLVPAQADEQEAAPVTEVAPKHRPRRQRRWPGDTDRGREEPVVVEATGVAELLQTPAEPLQRGSELLARDATVGVIGDVGQQRGEGAGRAVDALFAQVAENVHRRRGEVGGAHAPGDDDDLLSLLGEAQSGGQAGEAGADHDGVVAHAGRCSTSRMPWKIQSSRRAWRSWSPCRMGCTPFHRSSRKDTSARFASAWSTRSPWCRMPVAR